MRIVRPSLPTAIVPACLILLCAGAPGCSSGDGHAGAAPDSAASAAAAVSAPSEAPTARLGEPAPGFTLTDTDGRAHSLSDYAGKVVVLEWFNPECPFVRKQHVKTHNMLDTFEHARELGAVWLAVNSNAPGTQGNGLEKNRKAREDYGMEYPLLVDEDGAVGRLYGAKTTPHMFVIDERGVLIYRGAIDDNPSPVDLGRVNYVREALDAHAAGKPVPEADTKPYGCSVKYAS